MRGMFDFRFYEIWRDSEFLVRLAHGVWTSTWLTVLAGLIGFFLALFLASARRSDQPIVRIPAGCYVELIRNTPLIVQLFFIAFGLPMLLGAQWSFEASALLALSLNFSAYFTEIVRAGLDNLSDGQRDAALALSLTRWQRFRLIQLPQALGNVYPSITSQFVFLFLTTGIISEIGIEELTWSGRFIADRTFRDFEVFLVLTVLYVLMAVLFRATLGAFGSRAFAWKQTR